MPTCLLLDSRGCSLLAARHTPLRRSFRRRYAPRTSRFSRRRSRHSNPWCTGARRGHDVALRPERGPRGLQLQAEPRDPTVITDATGTARVCDVSAGRPDRGRLERRIPGLANAVVPVAAAGSITLGPARSLIVEVPEGCKDMSHVHSHRAGRDRRAAMGGRRCSAACAVADTELEQPRTVAVLGQHHRRPLGQ